MALGSREDLIIQLLEMSKNGSTKAKMKNRLPISQTQLRNILAELVDKGFCNLLNPSSYTLQLTKDTYFSKK
jgi:hypothetical protein